MRPTSGRAGFGAGFWIGLAASAPTRATRRWIRQTLSGTGKVTFQYGTVRFTISEKTVGPIAAFTLKGAQGGSAAGQANISPSADPVALTEACAGAGIAEAPVDIQATSTPSISG
jgi:hypothetical protein